MAKTERMTALKKVYAEIILNSTKEAAARIMVSEKKAFEFQRDLSVAKEEALRLLTRLKMMMDDKINEAERKSLVQQKRIEELEAQLQEAEDIVSSLRVELSDAHAIVGKLYRNQQQSFNKPNLIEDSLVQVETTLAENRLEENGTLTCRSSKPVACSNFNANISTLNHFTGGNRNKNVKSYWGGHSNVGSTDITSVKVLGKEPELYMNGWSQRTQVFQKNLFSGHLPRQLGDRQCDDKFIKEGKCCTGLHVPPLLGATKKHTVAKNPAGVKHGKRVDSSLFLRTKRMYKVEKKLAEVEEATNVNDTAHSMLAFKSFGRKRKRGVRRKRSEMSVLKFVSMEMKDASEFMNVSSSAVCLADSLKQLSLFYSDEDEDNSDSNMDSSVPSNMAKSVVPSESEGVTRSNADEAAATKDDIELADTLVLLTQENGFKNVAAVQSLQVSLKWKNDASVDHDVNVSDAKDGIACQLPKERVLKYTFRRKRKKEALGSADNENQQQKPSKIKPVKKQNNVFEAPKSSYGSGIILR